MHFGIARLIQAHYWPGKRQHTVNTWIKSLAHGMRKVWCTKGNDWRSQASLKQPNSKKLAHSPDPEHKRNHPQWSQMCPGHVVDHLAEQGCSECHLPSPCSMHPQASQLAYLCRSDASWFPHRSVTPTTNSTTKNPVREREREKTTKAWKTRRNPISKTKKRKLQQQTACPCKNGVLWINRRN